MKKTTLSRPTTAALWAALCVVLACTSCGPHKIKSGNVLDSQYKDAEAYVCRPVVSTGIGGMVLAYFEPDPRAGEMSAIALMKSIERYTSGHTLLTLQEISLVGGEGTAKAALVRYANK